MICSYCGGEVEWKGRSTKFPHTECNSCGARNCQLPEELDAEIVNDVCTEPTDQEFIDDEYTQEEYEGDLGITLTPYWNI